MGMLSPEPCRGLFKPAHGLEAHQSPSGAAAAPCCSRDSEGPGGLRGAAAAVCSSSRAWQRSPIPGQLEGRSGSGEPGH